MDDLTAVPGELTTFLYRWRLDRPGKWTMLHVGDGIAREEDGGLGMLCGARMPHPLREGAYEVVVEFGMLGREVRRGINDENGLPVGMAVLRVCAVCVHERTAQEADAFTKRWAADFNMRAAMGMVRP